MKIHVIGVCGTFMGSLALLASQRGDVVSGSDAHTYPPMSTLLADSGISVYEGYRPENLTPGTDLIVVGNAISRGNPELEAVLDRGMPYISGPQWLADHVLPGRWVVAVAGTHGKTTTSSLVAWILEAAGLEPGFLIGGVPPGLGGSARLGTGLPFVVEADEYDTALFDKRAKFVHYRPRTLVLNNLEYDHADIYPDLAAIQRQVHHLVRTLPANGLIVENASDPNLAAALALGCWTPRVAFVADAPDGARAGRDTATWFAWGAEQRLELRGPDGRTYSSPLPLLGAHNRQNAIAALLAAQHAGVSIEVGLEALARFPGVRRRLEQKAHVRGITVYDDFAHHPTAIAATLRAIRPRVDAQGDGGRLIAVVEPRSNTMKMGIHRDTLATALDQADLAIVLEPDGLAWSLAAALAPLGERARRLTEVESILELLRTTARSGDHIVIMSNGGFGGLPERLGPALAATTLDGNLTT